MVLENKFYDECEQTTGEDIKRIYQNHRGYETLNKKLLERGL